MVVSDICILTLYSEVGWYLSIWIWLFYYGTLLKYSSKGLTNLNDTFSKLLLLYVHVVAAIKWWYRGRGKVVGCTSIANNPKIFTMRILQFCLKLNVWVERKGRIEIEIGNKRTSFLFSNYLWDSFVIFSPPIINSTWEMKKI